MYTTWNLKTNRKNNPTSAHAGTATLLAGGSATVWNSVR